MTHTITYNPELKIVETTLQGTFTSLEIQGIASEILKIAKVNNCYILLNDFREAKELISTMEIYELPKRISEIAASLGLKISQFQRAAVVVRDHEDFNFFETVTFNQGQNMKVFSDIDEAKKWLSEK